MPEITMPRLSDTMEEGVVSAWLKQVGDRVSRGEVLAEIETDKALMELEAYDDGVLEQILAEPGMRVPIGEPIAIVGDGSGAKGAAAGPVSKGGRSGADAQAAAAEPVPADNSSGAGAEAVAPEPVLAGSGSNVGAEAAAAGLVPAGNGSGTGAEAAASGPVPAGASGAAAANTAARVGSPGVESSSVEAPGTAAAQRASGARQKSSPLARKIAGELGVDLAAVVGTGPGGRITRQDVEAAYRNAPAAGTPASAPADSAPAPATAAEPAAVGTAAANSVAGSAAAVSNAPVRTAAASPTVANAPAAANVVATASAVAANTAPTQRIPAPADYEEIPLTTIQRLSATRLTESKQQAPHIYLTSAIDVTDLLAFRARINETMADGKVSVNDLLVKAVASTLRKDPSVNVSFAGDKLLRHRGIHLGVAVATPAGLLVPVIRDADRKSVSEIAAESRAKATRARDRKLRADEMSGGTFTISNLGMFGIEQFTAVINPPESAILAVGGAADELRLEQGEVVSRKILRVTLSADHRAVDGAVAAQFLAQLKELLENPMRIVI